MRVKAQVDDEEGRSSVEFSVAEMLGRTGGLDWADLDEAERLRALEDYAAWLYMRNTGKAGRPHVQIDRSTLPH